jgi:hypothetical protein
VFGANGLAVRHEFPNTDYGSAFAVGNVDNDSALEIVTSGGYVFDGATFQNQWLYGPGFGNDVATGDLDGNGVAEIVAAVSWVALRTYSATLKTPLWEIPQSDLAVVIATNIDGDSADEILLGDGQWGSVTAYNYNATNNTATVIFSIDSQDHGVSAIGVGDLDHNDGGKLEFLWGTGASSSGADKLIVAGRNPAIEVEWTNTDPVQLDGPFVGGELAGTTTVADAPLYATAATDSGYAGSRLVRMDPTTGDLDVSKELGQLWQGVAALTVVDYDGDGVDEAFVGTGQFYDAYLTAYDVFQGAGGATEWTSPSLPQSQGVRTIVHSDLTGDGHDDLVAITSGGVVYVHDVFTQTLVWQSTTLGAGRDVVVADLDRDGSRDIIAVTQSGIYVYERVTGPLTYVQTATYSAQPYSEDFQDALIFDTDGDGELEVVALLLDSYIYDRASRLKRFDKSLAPLGDVQLAWRAETIVLEPSTAVRKNVLVPTQNWLGSPTEIVAVDVLTGGEAWRSPMLLGQIAKGSLHFVTIGGKRRITIGTGAGMYLTR